MDRETAREWLALLAAQAALAVAGFLLGLALSRVF